MTSSDAVDFDWLPRRGAHEDAQRLSRRVAMASDASHYFMVPAAVLAAGSSEHVAELMASCSRRGHSLTFRSGGTSLSGQGVTDGLLVDVRRSFKSIDVLDDGARVRVEPGATLAAVNARLRSYGRRLGPDPASEVACTIGGVIANNSSGMSCGLEANAYQTLESLVCVLPSGTVADTSDPQLGEQLRAKEPDLHRGLLGVRDRLRAESHLAERVRQQFSIKNTMGYSINAFLDFDEIGDILAHVLVGSEGTLAFVASVTMRTLPIEPHALTSLVVFDDLVAATDVVPALVLSGASTVELLDSESLRVAGADPSAAAAMRDVDTEAQQTALLVEYRRETAEAVAEAWAIADRSLRHAPGLAAPVRVTDGASARAALWRVRKGLYAAVAGNRPIGTTAILEDVAVPVARLSRTCGQLRAMFSRYGYDDAVVFGHAKDGNIHFMLSEDFAGSGRARYRDFTEDMVDLVLGENGSLKAEHGTGRVMAGWVRRQYGDDLCDLMWQLKRLFDPRGILSPGVVLNEDSTAYLSDLKSIPPADPETDRCVECGFCETVCPSANLTLTPRQRIVVRRHQARLLERGAVSDAESLDKDFEYDGVDTCAVDGMCQTTCPVHINTGDLVRRLRAERHGPVAQYAAGVAASHWSAVTTAASLALTVSSRAPRAAERASVAARRLLGAEAVPRYDRGLPRGGRRRHPTRVEGPAEVVLFSSCMGAIFGSPGDAGATSDAVLGLCDRVGIGVLQPPRQESLCCGTPWSSKGLVAGKTSAQESTRRALAAASDSGRLPIVCDAASCTEGLTEVLRGTGMSVLDSTSFVARHVLPRLDLPEMLDSIALHPTCSTERLGITDDLRVLASALAREVYEAPSWGCCAFAGDRGMLHPELTASATQSYAEEVRRREPDLLVSCNRTCEIGMSRAVGQTYMHIVEAVERAVGGRPLPAEEIPSRP